MFKKVIKNTYILSAGTLASRILGFVRDILIAKFFGTGGLLEAFLVAFRLPNIFRSILGEGFSDSVATPVLSEHQNDKNKVLEIGNHLLSLSIVILFLFTILGVVFAKFFVMIIAPGFISDAFKFNLAISFTRVTFIYLFLIGFSCNINAILYSLKRFFVPAVNPIFLNISFIIGIVFFSRFFNKYILIVCVIVAGILQVIAPIIALRRQGFIFRFDFSAARKDSEVIRMLKLFVPRIWSSIVYHLSVFVDTVFSSLASVVGEGALAAVYYGNRLIQFPFALIALSISQVAIVDLSGYHREGDFDKFKKLLVFSFQNIVFFVIPLSVFFIFFSDHIIDVIFVRGEFGAASLATTSSVLFFYSFGLFFFCGIKLLVNSFYSLKDTKTPAKTATLSLIANAVFSAILMFPLKIGGVALGSSLAAALNFFLLYRSLIVRIGEVDWQDSRSQFFKVFSLSIILAAILRWLWVILIFNKYINALIIGGIALAVFTIAGYIIGLKQLGYLGRWILRKR